MKKKTSLQWKQYYHKTNVFVYSRNEIQVFSYAVAVIVVVSFNIIE